LVVGHRFLLLSTFGFWVSQFGRWVSQKSSEFGHLTDFNLKYSIICGFEKFSVGFLTKGISHNMSCDGLPMFLGFSSFVYYDVFNDRYRYIVTPKITSPKMYRHWRCFCMLSGEISVINSYTY
jgi:hypothetical protein